MPTKRPLLPILLISLGILFILGAVFSIYLIQNNGKSSTSDPSIQNEQLASIERVAIQGAKAAYDAQDAVFVDVRDSSSYAEDHIPGAVSIPLPELEARLNELDPNGWIITYCT
jgi:hypothetical protein